MAINPALLFAAFVTADNVTMLTIRQSVTPAGLQGRVAVTNRFVAMGVVPLGALLGGRLGAGLGLRGAVLVTALGPCLALVPLGLSSPARIGGELPAARWEGPGSRGPGARSSGGDAEQRPGDPGQGPEGRGRCMRGKKAGGPTTMGGPPWVLLLCSW